MHRSILLMSCLVLLGAQSLMAEDSRSVVHGDSLNLVFASSLAAKLTWNHTITTPFLAGEGPLVSGNTIRLKTMAELSPVSINAKAELVLTPIAFLQFIAGGGLGSGWNLPIATGLALNVEDTADQGPGGEPFEALVWYGRAAGVFQFDLAAVVPGDWNHVVVQVTQGIRYRANSRASGASPWYWENDFGESVNGWTYQSLYVLGYQMPLILDMVALMAECDIDMYNTQDGALWGESLGYWVFGPLANFRFNKKLSAALIVQFRSMRNYTPETQDEAFFRNRELDVANPRRIEFYRAAINATWTLR